MDLTEEITEQLTYKMVTIPGIGFQIPKSVLISWGIIAFLVIFSIIMTRNLKLVPGKRQLVIEAIVGVVVSLFGGNLGEKGKRYIPYVGTVFLYLVVANIIGLFGITPPTKDMNITLGMALCTIVVVQYASVHEHGFLGWLKSFGAPIVIVAPMNVLELFIKPLSLCMRLFGNVMGAFIIMELLKMAIPMVVPLAASMYFDIFDGILQAFVFSFLTSLYISEAVE